MLVLLDTPQMHLLERTRRLDPGRYSSFRQTWKERGCVLVFTSTEARELRRYGDTARREGRYQVLADLSPIRTDLPVPGCISSGPRMLVEREIVCAMVERGLLPAPCPGNDPFPKRAWVLPWWLEASEVGALRELLESRLYMDLLNLEHDAARHRAAAEKMDGQVKKRGRVRDLSTAPLPVEAVLAARSEIEKQFALAGEQAGPEGLPAVSEDVRAAALDQALGFLDRAAELGNRAAYLERLPVTSLNRGQLLSLPTDELVERYGFEFCVRNFARDVLNWDESGRTMLAQALELSDCPGFWLQRRLERRIPRGCREPRPSHHSDAERLAYLPYVDLLLTDKQMAQFVHEIRSDKATPAAIREARPAERITDTMNALAQVIFSRGVLA